MRPCCLFAVGMLLSSAASVRAQVYTDPFVVPAIGEEYIAVAPTVVAGVPVRVMPRRVVIRQHRRIVMRPAVTVIAPVVTETRVIRPAPVIEQRIVQPAPVVQQRMIWPAPVVQTRAIVPYGW